MNLAEKAAFYQELCSLGYSITDNETGEAIVQKAATCRDGEVKAAEQFNNRTAAVDSVKEQIDWKWHDIEQPAALEPPAEQLPEFEIYAEFHDGYEANHAELGVVAAKSEDDLKTKATRAAEAYFAKTFPDKPIEKIMPRIKWRRYIKAE